MKTARFVIEASSTSEDQLRQLEAELATLVKQKFNLTTEMNSTVEETQGMEKKEIVLTIVLSITANFATDGIKEVYDLINQVEVKECEVEVMQLAEED